MEEGSAWQRRTGSVYTMTCPASNAVEMDKITAGFHFR